MFRHHLLIKRKDRKKRRKENFEFEFFWFFGRDFLLALVFFTFVCPFLSLSLLDMFTDIIIIIIIFGSSLPFHLH